MSYLVRDRTASIHAVKFPEREGALSNRYKAVYSSNLISYVSQKLQQKNIQYTVVRNNIDFLSILSLTVVYYMSKKLLLLGYIVYLYSMKESCLFIFCWRGKLILRVE